jgi:hypothetical protein
VRVDLAARVAGKDIAIEIEMGDGHALENIRKEFIRYPRSTHDLSRTGEPWLLVDRLSRLRQWFAHWLDVEGTITATESGLR